MSNIAPAPRARPRRPRGVPASLWIGLLAAGLAVVACGAETPASDDDAGGGGAGGVDDGKLRPPPNGTRISEAEACERLREAFRDRITKIGCVKTARTCPDFLRAHHDPDCAEVDEGSVQGCVAYYEGIQTCEALVDDHCLVTVYPETAPAGCP